MTNLNQTTLRIEGMSCEHCVRAVEKALRSVDGVQDAQVDLASGSARVQGNADPARLIEAVAAEGYTAVL